MGSERIEELLTEIRDLQRQGLTTLERSAEVVERQTEIVERTHKRAEQLQDRAEAMQTKSEIMVNWSSRTFVILIPILLGLVGYVSWLLFRKLGY